MTFPFSRTLKYTVPMMQGADVKALQDALVLLGILHHTGADGLFGPGTKRAVKTFQRHNGLVADGIAGSKTFARLGPQSAPPSADPTTPPTMAAAPDGAKIPESWMPAAEMRRIILHWTGGSHRPSSLDKKHYHIVIDGDGDVHRGKNPISANVPPLRSKSYAAHTRGSNSHSIGVSLCAMGGDSRERPFRPGPFPITREQWDTMMDVAAELCLRYGIEVNHRTVLGHGEVQKNLGITQNGKWDPMVVPWDVGRPYGQVGDAIRSEVKLRLDALRNPPQTPQHPTLEPDEIPPSETVTLDGKALRGASFDGRVWIDLAHLVESQGWSAPLIDTETMSATLTDPDVRFGVEQTPDVDGFVRTWVEAPEVSERLELILREDDAGDVHLESVPETAAAELTITVKRGQTLSKLARQHLGDSNRWRELRTEDGTPFDEESARRLRVGQVVLLPDGSSKKTTPDAGAGVALKARQITDIAAKISRLEGGSSTMQKTRSDAVSAILKACVDNTVHDMSHQAYILATAYHETNLGQFMTELWGPTTAQKTYGNRLGNRSDAEGKLYLGRGFVQITGRNNYIKYGKIYDMDFVENPQQVAKPEIAAKILVQGMSEFGFTGKGLLADMGFDGDFDWVRARSLINGDMNLGGDSRYPGLTKGQGIANKAIRYRDIIATA